MKKNKVIIIIFVTFLSFIFGGGCYYFFYLSNKSSGKGKEIDFYKFACSVCLLRLQEIANEQKKTIEENVNQEELAKNVEILINQGIWDWLFGVDLKECLEDNTQRIQNTFQPQIDELLEKVRKKEKKIESFDKELEKILEEMKKESLKNIKKYIEITKRIKEEAEKPMPLFAMWIVLLPLAIICPLISFFIVNFLREKFCYVTKIYEEGGTEISTTEECFSKKLDPIFLMLICFPLQFLIFPLINCLFSLKMSTLREIYKHYFYNCFKLIFLILMFFGFNCFLGVRCCCDDNKSN